MAKCIAFTGGGTAGHVYPALAVLEELVPAWGGRIIWIGSLSGLERRILGGQDLRFYGIPAGKLRRYFSWRNALDIFAVLAGLLASLYILLRERPVLLFSKGGYVSVPPVVAARLLRIPVLTHESDLDPGLATRINARFADSVLISFSESRNLLSASARPKAVHTGNPVRRALLSGDAQEGRRITGCPPGARMVLVLGGSLGSSFINRTVVGALDGLCARSFVVHQMGAGHFRPSSRSNYYGAAYFSEELPHLLAAAELVVSRAGANTLWELALLGKPALLIPLPRSASRGDQIENARHFASRGAAVMLEEQGLTSEVLETAVLHLLGNESKLRQMAACASALAKPEAAAVIAGLLLQRARPAGEQDAL
jgi:UDP-N-acetylglucosamine--N-acetylmuramyl-(pentapeptide) pyrophosphoryl-undecaprenol N-acetylglucosamine transferase